MTIKEARQALVTAVCLYAGSCGKGATTEWGTTSDGVVAAMNNLITAARAEDRQTLKRIAEHECQCCSGDCGCGFEFQQWAKAALAMPGTE